MSEHEVGKGSLRADALEQTLILLVDLNAVRRYI